jgi:tRNA A-37 threonylcarbamoyl transferase component Bud32
VSALFGIDHPVSPAPGERPSLYRVGELVAGRYVVRELIGSGPLGLLYRAENRNTGAVLALRVVWPELVPDDAARGRFLRQAIRARTVQNRYVAPLFEAFIEEVGGEVVCLLAVKHLPGPTLASRIANRMRHGVPLLAVEAQPVVSQIGVGLSAIHARGLVHGNINSNNVFIIGDEVRIADLGVASALPVSVVALAEEHAGRGRGRAPEAVAGHPCSPASDVYGFAVVTAQMLGLLSGRSREEVPIPASVRVVLRRALSRNPRDRYLDVDAFAGALVTAFERADQRSAIGLRAVAPPAEGATPARAFESEHSAAIVGALEIPPELGDRIRGQRRSVAASVVVDPDALESRTPVTLPPVRTAARREEARPQPRRPAPAITSAPSPPMAPPLARPWDGRQALALDAVTPPLGRVSPGREAVGRERARARVPFSLILLLLVVATTLSAGIVRNVIVGSFEERIARARVEKAELLRRVGARPPAARPLARRSAESNARLR